jgi:site-specific recombinase XerD
VKTDLEINAIVDRLRFVRSHSAKCRNDKKRWDGKPAERWTALNAIRCTCPIYSCGVHDPSEGFQRKLTGEIVERKAREVVEKRLKSGNEREVLEPVGVPIKTAIEDFMGTLVTRELSEGTTAKYTTIMNQLQSFSDYGGYKSLQAFATPDAMDLFFKSWSDPDAGYKKGTKWTKVSRRTAKDNLKTMRLFFRRCLKRKWISEDPSTIIEVTPEPRAKTKEQVKYLTRQQMKDIMFFLERTRRTPYQKQRLKALMLTMRWTGLRISDAVALEKSAIKNGVLYVKTKKSKTPVQFPLPDELLNTLAKLTNYDNGYYFWDGNSDIKYARLNYGHAVSDTFELAGVKEEIVHSVSHRFRNTFAVHLLSKGVPLETVSLMLGHQNISTTENYYADFASGYMDRAENMIRKVWTLKEDESLQVAAA